MPSATRSDLPKLNEGLPLIDFAKYNYGLPEEKSMCRELLLKSLSTQGFARLTNCGISNEDVDRCFQYSSQFFKLPADVKFKIENPRGPMPQRGYSHVGAESSSALYAKLIGDKSSKVRSDAREHFDQGSEDDDQYPNKFPPEGVLPGFHSFMQQFYKQSEDISLLILQSLEESLHIPPTAFRDCIGGASELRLNHYPPISIRKIREGDVNRIWPHFDLGVLTLLWTRGSSGLECQNNALKNGQQHHNDAFTPIVPESQYELIINVSETLQRWTNDKLRAGLHQVTIPPDLRHLEDGVIPDRYSIAYFCKARRSAGVGSMEHFFVAGAEKPRYANMTALEYHQSRLQAAY